MKMIIGLGNPGKEYVNTKHNVGFMVIDAIAKELNETVEKKQCQALTQVVNWDGEKILLVKPQTYMNLSGDSIRDFCSFYKIPPENLLVIYDDYDLPKGKVRIRASGSAGTHNGMRSVIGETGLTNFARIRIGIRDEEVNIPIINYVLSEVRKEDYEVFGSACKKAGEAAADFARCPEM